MDEYRSRPSLIWPIVLIGAGTLFLLNNLGIVDWDVWTTIAQFWPLILVAIGLDIMLGRRAGIWPALLLVFVIAVLASGAIAVQNTSEVFMGDLYTQEFSQQIEDAEKAKVTIEFGVGSLKVNAFTNSRYLANGAFDLAEGEQLQQDFRMHGSTAYLSLGSKGHAIFPAWWFGKNDGRSREWHVNINDDIPMELEVCLGVGKAELDLRQVELNTLNMETGVGKTVVYLPEDGDFNAFVQAGVGELIVYVPESLPIRITLDSGLGNNSVVGDFDRSNNVYTSQGYSQSEERVNLNVDGGVGNIKVIEMGE